MTALRKLLAFIRNLLLLALLILAITAGLLPGLTGMILRSNLSPALASLSASDLLRVEVEQVKAGWFSTDYELRIRSDAFAVDSSSAAHPARLHINHGPIMWHLYDTRFALADFTLAPMASDAHFSGSGLLRLSTQGMLRLDAITGVTAFEGDHWLQTRANWPLASQRQGWRAVLREMDLELNIDAHAGALMQSPLADALQVYQQQGWTRISNGRARSTITLQDELLNINGVMMPAGLFLASPEMR